MSQGGIENATKKNNPKNEPHLMTGITSTRITTSIIKLTYGNANIKNTASGKSHEPHRRKTRWRGTQGKSAVESG
jgi:hypothetical protein